MKSIQDKIKSNFIKASSGYANVGLDLFYKTRYIASQELQSAIGNLSIAIELLIKGYIAQHSLLLVYQNVPLELKCALCAPNSMPPTFKVSPYKIEIESSSKIKAIELNEAINVFYVFQPEFKKHFSAHLNLLSHYRNICVHGTMQDFQLYEASRIVFLFLSLVKFINKTQPKLLKSYINANNKRNETFLKHFDEERHKKVYEAIEEAKKKAKTITGTTSLYPEGWNSYPVECPVCKNDGFLSGDTEEDIDVDHRSGDIMGVGLIFNGDSFKCNECGLALEDYDELLIAGIEPTHDRSEEIDEWNYGDEY